MEKFIYEKINIIRDKKAYQVITGILFPVVIVLFALCKVNQGMEITDSTYSLSNFRDVSAIYDAWFFSTFYANLLGSFLVGLPVIGKSFLWMNLLTSLFKTATALLAYFFFTKTVKVPRELVFLAELVALGLCWCPSTILYNYVTYFVFFLGCAFLYSGLMKEKKSYLVIAGFLLGSNIFVRLPNVAEALLIVAVFCYSICKKEKFKECLNKTLLCVGGYLLAFVPAIILMLFNRGVKAYISGIVDLGKMGSEVSDYSAFNQIRELIDTYVLTWPYVEKVFFMVVLCLLAFLVLPTKATWLRYVAATAITVAYGMSLYRENVCTKAYWDYGAIYMISNLMLVVMLVWFSVVTLLKSTELGDRLLAIMGIVIILVSPLGSNNVTYTDFNNLFFVFPSFLYLLVRFVRSNEYFRGIRYSILLLSLAFSAQCLCFGVRFVFRDGIDGKLRDSEVTSLASVKGIKTTADNAKRMQELGEYWEKVSPDRKLLLFGEVSGLGYYLDCDIAISTAWPTLDSFSSVNYDEQMTILRDKLASGSETYPIVIIEANEYNNITHTTQNTKQEILKKFLEESDYFVDYSNERFLVLDTNK